MVPRTSTVVLVSSVVLASSVVELVMGKSVLVNSRSMRVVVPGAEVVVASSEGESSSRPPNGMTVTPRASTLFSKEFCSFFSIIFSKSVSSLPFFPYKPKSSSKLLSLPSMAPKLLIAPFLELFSVVIRTSSVVKIGSSRASVVSKRGDAAVVYAFRRKLSIAVVPNEY